MLVPVDPIFVLIPLLSLTAPTDPSDLGRYQPADDIFDDLALASFRRLAHKHNERVLSSVRAAAATEARNARNAKGKGKGKPRSQAQIEQEMLEGTELLEEEGVWADVHKLGAAKAGVDALARVCDAQGLGNGLNVYRFNPGKALEVLRGKVLKIADQSVFGSTPNTLGRTYARTLAKMGDEHENNAGGASRSASDDAMELDDGTQAPPVKLSKEERVQLQVAIGAVSAWLDEAWRAKLERSFFPSEPVEVKVEGGDEVELDAGEEGQQAEVEMEQG